MRLGTFAAHVEEACKQRGISLEDCASKMKSFGISNVCIDGNTAEDPEAIKKKYEAVGLSTADAYININFISGGDIRGEAERLITRAARPGIERIQITTEAYSDPTDAKKRKSENLMVAEGLSYCAELAKKLGIKTVIEDYDCNNGPLSYSADMKYILDNAPNVFFAFDSGNFVYTGEDEVQALELMKDKIAHVHFKDRSLTKYKPEEKENVFTSLGGKKYYPCPVGSGVIHYVEIARIMKEVSYDGMILLEHFGSGDQLSYLERSAEFVKKLLGI